MSYSLVEGDYREWKQFQKVTLLFPVFIVLVFWAQVLLNKNRRG